MPNIKKKYKLLSLSFTLLSFVLAVMALVAWFSGAPGSAAYKKFIMEIAPNTAVILIIISLIQIVKIFGQGKRNLSDFLILESVIIYAISVIMAMFMKQTWHPEELLARFNMAADGVILGSMSPLTALELILLALAFLLIHTDKTKKKQINWGIFLLIWALIISYITIFAHITNTQLLPRFGIIPMSLPSSLAMFSLSLALLEYVGNGFGYLFRYLSGHGAAEDKSINRLNAGLYIVLILLINFAAFSFVYSENKLYKQNLKEQLSLGLDARKNMLNTWTDYHYEHIMEARENPDLAEGIRNISRGDTRSTLSIYAMAWMHFSFRKEGNAVTIYDVNRGLTNTNDDGKSHPFSLVELRDIQQILKTEPVYIQERFLDFDSKLNYHKVSSLRFWVPAGPVEDGILFLTEHNPDEFIQLTLNKSLSGSGQNRSFLYSKGKEILHSISAASGDEESYVRELIRHNLSLDSQSVLGNCEPSRLFDQKGAEYRYVACSTEHLPWLIVNVTNVSAHGVRLALKAWISLLLSLFLSFVTALTIRQGSRRKAIRDGNVALNQWRTTFDAIPHLIWLLDKNFRILRSNSAVKYFFGIDPQDALGKDSRELLPALQELMTLESFKKGERLTRENAFENMWLSITSVPVLDDDDTLVAYAQIVSDHTERKRILEKLKIEEERFRAIFEQSPVGIFMLSKGLEYLHGNPSLQNMLGYPEKELQGRKLLSFVHKDSHAAMQKGLDSLLKGKEEVFSMEKKFLRQDGTSFWGLTKNILIQDNALGKGFILCILENIQERMEVMQELYHSREIAVMNEKLKSNFMQNISHEFRTPLNGIIGFSQVLVKNILDAAEVQEYADLIYRSGKRMQEMIENILNFANINAGRSQVLKCEFNLEQMLNKIYQLYLGRATSKSLEFICEMPEEQRELFINSDEAKIMQIMVKLLDNAINFTQKGKVHCRVLVENNQLLVQVEDTGIGIPKDKQAHIFEDFYQADMSFTRDQEGAGLGLAICQGLAKTLDGDISLESTEGVGTIVKVRIPL